MLRLAREASDFGLGIGDNALGHAYRCGHGVAKDVAAGYAWYRRAAEKGYALGQTYAGLCLTDGVGVDCSILEGRLWLLKAALQDEPMACHELGKMTDTPVDGTEGKVEAHRWFLLAAEAGYARSQRRIAWHYLRGEGVPKDDAEAARWMFRSALQGDVRARGMYGWMKLCGIGVWANPKVAVDWLSLAAKAGDPLGCYFLAQCHATSQVPEPDARTMKALLLQAANAGFPPAQYTLGLFLRDEGTKASRALAVDWLRAAMRNGVADAAKALRDMRHEDEKRRNDWRDPGIESA